MKNILHKILSCFLACSVLWASCPMPAMAQGAAALRKRIKKLAPFTELEKKALSKILLGDKRVLTMQMAAGVKAAQRMAPAREVIGSQKAIDRFNDIFRSIASEQEWEVPRYIRAKKPDGTIAFLGVDSKSLLRNDVIMKETADYLEGILISSFEITEETMLPISETPRSYFTRNAAKMEKQFKQYLVQDRMAYVKGSDKFYKWFSKVSKQSQTELIGKISHGNIMAVKGFMNLPFGMKMKHISRLVHFGGKIGYAMSFLVLIGLVAAAPDANAAHMAERLQKNPAILFSLNDEGWAVIDGNDDLQTVATLAVDAAEQLAAMPAQDRQTVVNYVFEEEKAERAQNLLLKDQLKNLKR